MRPTTVPTTSKPTTSPSSFPTLSHEEVVASQLHFKGLSESLFVTFTLMKISKVVITYAPPIFDFLKNFNFS